MAYVYRVSAVALVLIISGHALGDVKYDLPVEPSATVAIPAKPDQAVQDHYRALKLYLKARKLEEDNKLLDAVHSYEQVLRLEPNAAIYKALIPICFSLDRDQEALEYCEKALALDPKDFDLLCLYGRELQERNRHDEAAATLAKAVRHPAAKEQPERMAQMCFELAMVYEDLKAYENAARTYEKVLEVFENPEIITELTPQQQSQVRAEVAKTYEKIGRMELQAKQYDKAVAAFRKAQEKDAARAARLNYNLAEVYLAKNDPEKALERLRRYIDTQPTGGEAYKLLAEVLTKLGRGKEVIPSLERAATKDTFNQPLKNYLGQHYLRDGQLKKADEVFSKAWKDNPSEEVYEGLAAVYRRQGRWRDLLDILDRTVRESSAEALRHQLKVLAAQPHLVEGLATAILTQPSRGANFAFKTRRVLASLCRHVKKYDDAEQLCRLCLADDPQPGEVYLELCRVLSEAHKYEALAQVCREAMGKQLVIPKLVFELEMARSLALAGKEDEGVAAARQTLKNVKAGSEDDFRAGYALATIYYRCNHLDEAVKECERLLDKFSTSSEQRQVTYLLSGIHTARQDNAKAEECLQKVLAADPNDATANNDLGYTWAEQGKNLEEAEKLIRKAIELDRLERARKRGPSDVPEAERDNAAYIDSLGWVLFKRGQSEEAAKVLERATKLADGGDDPVIWDHLGDVYQELGQLKDARRVWQKSLELYKTSKRVGLEDRRRQVADKLKSLNRQLTKGGSDKVTR